MSENVHAVILGSSMLIYFANMFLVGFQMSNFMIASSSGGGAYGAGAGMGIAFFAMPGVGVLIGIMYSAVLLFSTFGVQQEYWIVLGAFASSVVGAAILVPIQRNIIKRLFRRAE